MCLILSDTYNWKVMDLRQTCFHTQSLAKHGAHKKPSINICWMNEEASVSTFKFHLLQSLVSYLPSGFTYLISLFFEHLMHKWVGTLYVFIH